MKKSQLIKIIKEEISSILGEQEEESGPAYIRKKIQETLDKPDTKLAFAFYRLQSYGQYKMKNPGLKFTKGEMVSIYLDDITPALRAIQMEYNGQPKPPLEKNAEGFYTRAKENAFSKYNADYFMEQSEPIDSFKDFTLKAYSMIKNTKFS